MVHSQIRDSIIFFKNISSALNKLCSEYRMKNEHQPTILIHNASILLMSEWRQNYCIFVFSHFLFALFWSSHAHFVEQKTLYALSSSKKRMRKRSGENYKILFYNKCKTLTLFSHKQSIHILNSTKRISSSSNMNIRFTSPYCADVVQWIEFLEYWSQSWHQGSMIIDSIFER